MRKVKLGIIGTGICIQELYWPELQKMTDKFEIVAIAGNGSEKGKKFAENAGIKLYYSNYMDLLSNKDIEAVCIAFPFTMNHEIACAAMRAGKHIMVEKPMATCLEDAMDMLEQSKRVTTVAILAENFRYRKMLVKIRQIMEEGRIGQPYTFIWNLIGYTPRTNKYITDSTWRLKSHYGLLFDGSVHFISMFRELFGEIKSGIGYTTNSNKDMGTNDTVV